MNDEGKSSRWKIGAERHAPSVPEAMHAARVGGPGPRARPRGGGRGIGARDRFDAGRDDLDGVLLAGVAVLAPVLSVELGPHERGHLQIEGQRCLRAAVAQVEAVRESDLRGREPVVAERALGLLLHRPELRVE